MDRQRYYVIGRDKAEDIEAWLLENFPVADGDFFVSNRNDSFTNIYSDQWRIWIDWVGASVRLDEDCAFLFELVWAPQDARFLEYC